MISDRTASTILDGWSQPSSNSFNVAALGIANSRNNAGFGIKPTYLPRPKTVNRQPFTEFRTKSSCQNFHGAQLANQNRDKASIHPRERTARMSSSNSQRSIN